MRRIAATGLDVDISITEPGFFTRPDYFDVLARLRRDAPVFCSEPNTWLLTRYDDIRVVGRDPERFVSSRGVLVNDPLRTPGAAAIEGSMLHMDPPQHRDYRRLVTREFTAAAAGRLEARVTEFVRGVLDALPAGEEIDFVERVAMPIPVMVIAELLGVGDAQLHDFRRWSDAMIAITDNPTSETFASTMEFMAFLNDHIAARTAAPQDDLISRLAGTTLTASELLMFCVTLLVAGNETTRHLLSGGAQALAEHPDQRAQLCADPELLPAAVEELLRWVTPIQAFGRTAVTDVELGGATIRAGDFAVLLYASGNRDEAAFGPAAGQLDVTRPIDTMHVAFGFGEHLCLGASLARLEARIVFGELLARFPHYELAAPPVLAESTLVRGAHTMPVVLA